MARKAQGISKQDKHRFLVYSLFIILFGLSFVATRAEITAPEASVFNWIYTMPDSLRWFALVATQFGNPWMAVGLVGLLFVVRWNPRLSLVVLRNSLLTYAVVWLMKFVIDRPRPMILLHPATSRQVAVLGSGFPSAHTALATVLSLTLLPYVPKKLRWLPVVWIGLVGWSRIYLGVHTPIDVAAGFIIGVLVVLLADALPWPVQKPSRRT